MNEKCSQCGGPMTFLFEWPRLVRKDVLRMGECRNEGCRFQGSAKEMSRRSMTDDEAALADEEIAAAKEIIPAWRTKSE